MLKRSIDITLGSVLLIAVLPVIVGVGLILAFDLRTWPIFVQHRIGRGGRHFRFVKLRTLSPSTPRYALKPAIETAPISPMRRRIRQLHLDELPQLVLVLVGAMSLVGPRPKMPDEHEPVDPHYGTERMRVAPGCTGLWQISAYVNGLPSEAPEFDLFYVEHTNIRLDLWILWRTVLVMVGLGRPIELEDVPTWTLRRDGPTPAQTRRQLPGGRTTDEPKVVKIPELRTESA